MWTVYACGRLKLYDSQLTITLYTDSRVTVFEPTRSIDNGPQLPLSPIRYLLQVGIWHDHVTSSKRGWLRRPGEKLISLIRRYLVFIFSQGSYSVFIARAQFSVEYRLLWIPADYWTNKRASFSKSHIGSEGFW